jgi:ubiquinone/menaquinone biosynthesis C-methylase UbiE
MIDHITREYIKTQLEYDNKTDIISTNSQAMVKISHDLIIKTAKEFAKKNKVYLLDIGCGWGDFSNKLNPYIEDYIGVEPSFIELDRFIKSSKCDNRYLVRGFGEFLDFIKDNSRNVILLNSVLDHCYDWAKAIENCIRILSPGGIIIVAMENSEKIPSKLRRFLKIKVIHHGHLSFLSGADLEKIFQSNFQLIKKKTIGFLFGFDYLTKRIPISSKIMLMLNNVTNKIFQIVLPNSGHLLFYVFVSNQKNVFDSNFDKPFICPSCKNDLQFGMYECSNCKLNIEYLNSRTMDALQLAREMKVGIPIPLSD